MHPLPVPTSITRGAAIFSSRPRLASTRTSVSGRGMSTAGPTTNSWRQKAWVPVRC